MFTVLIVAIAVGTLVNLLLLIRVFNLIGFVDRTTRGSLENILTEVLTIQESKTEGSDILGREWYTEWPRMLSKRELEKLRSAYSPLGVPRYPNPEPFESSDEYARHLLVQRYRSCDAFHRVKLLEQLRAVSLIPDDLAALAVADASEFVRMWAASHLTGLETYEDSKTVPSTTFKTLSADSSAFVRAALLSNPESPNLPWSRPWGLEDDWRERLKNYGRLECLALMYNPKLEVRLLVELMQNTSEDLGLGLDLQKQMIRAGLQNPHIIEWGRSFGRKHKVTHDRADVIDPDKDYAEIWRLAFDKWLSSPIPRLTALYIQTTPEAKLEIYKRFEEGMPNASWYYRSAILKGCMMPGDEEILRLGLQDGETMCKEEAEWKMRSWEEGRFEFQAEIH